MQILEIATKDDRSSRQTWRKDSSIIIVSYHPQGNSMAERRMKLERIFELVYEYQIKS